MAAPELMPRFTYRDYQQWENRWELIDGIPYAMAPAPYPKHQKTVFAVARELDRHLNCIFKNVCEIYIAPVDWKVSDTTVVQPDVALFCEQTEKQYFSKKPLLIVEVLSRATALKDTTTKFELYECEGVPSYIIIDPDSERAEIFELHDGAYKCVQKVEKDGVYRFRDKECETEIDFKKVFT